MTVHTVSLSNIDKASGLTPFGPEILPGSQGVRFRLWAPSARNVELILNQPDGDVVYPMQADTDGWHVCQAREATHGSRYQYRINGELNVPDPASRYQPDDVHGPSQIVDFSKLSASKQNWQGRPWDEVILYELHVGTFSPEGTFQGVKNKLDYLKDLGVTAIELMPVADFPGKRNWGYDGVLQFAPDSSYGTPQDLRDLIDAAHEKGLMVFLDVVYNHFGPDGNYLHVYAEPFFTEHHHTPWGAALNFEGRREVRDFFIQNALYWLNEYRFDGLRFDAVHAIYDDSEKHFLHELAETVRAHIEPGRHVHLVLENDDNASRFIANKNLSGKEADGFDAQWNDDFHHAAHVIATGEAGGYYEDYAPEKTGKTAVAHLARCLAEGFAYQGDPSPYRENIVRGERSIHLPTTAFVNFIQNHDQIGNRAFGDRLNQSTEPEALKALLACLLLSPGIPLLFMGQEWAAETPFQFFCDFGGELARLVTEGRRKEFAKFPEFSRPENREKIPDPSSAQTFENSRLDWSELHQPKHADWLNFYKQLLALRKSEIIPLLPEILSSEEERSAGKRHGSAPTYEVFATSGLQVQWRLSGGRRLQLTANLGPLPLTAPPGVLDNLKLETLKLIDGSGTFSPKDSGTGQLPAWFVIWQTG